MSEKVLLNKLKSVGNPFTLLKMMNDIRVFVKQHQVNFPKSEEQAIYVQVDHTFYKFEQNVIKECPAVTAGNYIFVSEVALGNLRKLIDVNNDAPLSDVLLQLRKIKNLKQYKVLLQAIDEDFQTNMKMSDLVEIAINLQKEK